MKVEIFNLCDYASSDMSGKMTMVGVFDSVYVRNIPILIMYCSLAVRVRFEKHEEGIKRLTAKIVDSDGLEIVPPTETIVQVQVPPEWTTATAQIVAMLPQLQLPHFGEYLVVLDIDGRLEATTPLYARQIPTTLPQFQIPQRPV